MHLALVDWIIVAAYLVFAVVVGLHYAKRAGSDVDQFFLSGRSLPWWIAGTSMVATTFAADTPLVITGWVRDAGIWKNWLWWCYAGGGMLTVFLFARYWRRGHVMTTAELAELRYGGDGARTLRGFLGFYHAGVTNTIVLCWVLLAATKIMDVALGVDKVLAVVVACALALSYSLLAGFWGVVVTDLVQFAMAMAGSIVLAVLAWNAIGGSEELLAQAARGGGFTPDTLSFFPATGPGGLFSPSFWTVSAAAVAVYLGVAWWAAEAVDGGGLVVQRIAATRDERNGVLAALWYNVAHYALRPWPWIAVALASIIVLPHIDVPAPVSGTIASIEADAILIAAEGGGELIRVDLAAAAVAEDWTPHLIVVSEGEEVVAGDVLARSDSERAYVVMMTRYLPVGLLGLVVASLLAAFMSTIDTHVNLASSYFVNDVYRRFVRKDASPRHYVAVARVTGVVVMSLAGVLAWQSDSIADLFTFFLTFLGGVGPIYVLRWLWWRVRASTEITAMLTSSISASLLTMYDEGWPLGALAPDGVLGYEGRLCLVVALSTTCALLSMHFTRAPDPERLVAFYRRIRPIGIWGPVRALCPDVEPPREGLAVLGGVLGGLATVYGLMIGVGFWLLDRGVTAPLCCAAAGAAVVTWSLGRLTPRARDTDE